MKPAELEAAWSAASSTLRRAFRQSLVKPSGVSEDGMARQAASREQSPSHLDVKRLLITGYPPIVHELAATFLLRPHWKTRVLPIPPTARRYAWPLGVARAMPRVDLWYQLGGPMRERSFFLSRFCSTIDLPTIIHWTGVDVVVAQRLVQRHRWLHRLLTRAHHWACAPWLVGELARIMQEI